jgi:hypothetical protein
LPKGTALLIAIALAGAPSLWARAEDQASPPPPEPNPQRQKGTLPGDAATIPWAPGEIDAAKAKCEKLLAVIKLEYEMLPPSKDGLCGAPAPILVKSVGEPKVKIEPAATMTCALAASLEAWLKDKVQPEAAAVFGSRVVKLENASSYVCRNRNNGTNTPLSEHALANALDISAFVLQSGERIAVLESWPRALAGEPAALPNPSEAADITGSIAPPLPDPKPLPSLSRPRSEGVKVTKAKSGAANPPVPPPVAKPPPPRPLAERKTLFVRAVHDDACRLFGTVLGPDADAAHKSHFHLDMRSRRSGLRLCQ